MLELISQEKLTLTEDISWPDVFAIWRYNEAFPGSHWHEHYRGRGFNTWEEWRLTYVRPLHLDKLSWRLYTVVDPKQTGPQFCGGPFRSWVELYYQGKEHPQFSQIIKHPQIENNETILHLISNFPDQTTLSGVILNDKIIIVEGMHRCCALALAANKGIKVATQVKIALAESDQPELPLIGQYIK
jgi:hypothetical protein